MVVKEDGVIHCERPQIHGVCFRPVQGGVNHHSPGLLSYCLDGALAWILKVGTDATKGDFLTVLGYCVLKGLRFEYAVVGVIVFHYDVCSGHFLFEKALGSDGFNGCE